MTKDAQGTGSPPPGAGDPGSLVAMGADVRRDEATNRIRKVRGEFPPPQGDDLESSVRAFLQAHATEMDLKASDLRLRQAVETNSLRDPAAAGTCGSAPSSLATIDAERVARPFRDLTLAGGVHRLEGPFVKLRDFGPPNVAPPTEAVASGFDYPSNDDRFEAVMVYHHVDTLQRHIQSLGVLTAHNWLGVRNSADAHPWLRYTSPVRRQQFRLSQFSRERLRHLPRELISSRITKLRR